MHQKEKGEGQKKESNVAETGVWPTMRWFEKRRKNLNNVWYGHEDMPPTYSIAAQQLRNWLIDDVLKRYMEVVR